MWIMRVLVLGGTGFTGPFLVRRLHHLGHDVTVFHRGEHAAELPSGVRRLHGAFNRLPDELRQLQPDVVVHMWALTEEAARSFVQFFRGFAGRAVVISSCDVYRAYGLVKRLETGEPGEIPIREDGPLRTSRFPYPEIPAYDKILVEQALSGHADLPVTILRYPAVYGPGDSYHRFAAWLRQMEAGLELRLQDSYSAWCWTHDYVENVAEATVLAATQNRAAGRVYNVGEAETPTMLQRVEELGRAIGWRGRVTTTAIEYLPLDFAHHLAIDTTRIRSELGYQEPVCREDGLRRTAAWERTAP